MFSSTVQPTWPKELSQGGQSSSFVFRSLCRLKEVTELQPGGEQSSVAFRSPGQPKRLKKVQPGGKLTSVAFRIPCQPRRSKKLQKGRQSIASRFTLIRGQQSHCRSEAEQFLFSQSKSIETVEDTAGVKPSSSSFRTQSHLRRSKTLQVWSRAVPLFALKVTWDGRRHCRCEAEQFLFSQSKSTETVEDTAARSEADDFQTRRSLPEETAGITVAIREEDHRLTAAARYGERLVSVDICVISFRIVVIIIVSAISLLQCLQMTGAEKSIACIRTISQ